MIPVFVLGMFLAVQVGAQGMGPGMMGPGYGRGPGAYGERCPYCGQYLGPHGGYGMGPGMMGYGRGMGPGGMHHGYGMMSPGYGPGYPSPSPYQQPRRAWDEDDVRRMLKNYIRSMRNPNIKVGKIEDKGSRFEAQIVTKDDSLIDKIAVDKQTGWMRSIY